MAVSNSRVLIVYEGDTERIFYQKVIADLVERKGVKLAWKPANSESNIAFHTIVGWINRFLSENAAVKHLHVVVVYDREGDFDIPDKLELSRIEKKIANRRLASLNQIIATRQLESWFHYDAEGIYDFCSVAKKDRKKNPHPNPHNLTSNNLNTFCKKFGKQYRKGKEAKDFIGCLNLDTIYVNCEEFRNGVDLLKKLL